MDGLEKNIEVDAVPLYKEFDYDEWPEDSRIISGENVTTIDEVIKNEKDRVLKQA